ncbi:GGDEF domain-containing protein [Halomonas sp. M20]|uniref:GGDEF domain-containing protein n=1 Tax=Halomonas sp. M20 TaxID=2763264 RepID=UPI001D0B3846|nr:GGDEF domain-containing protein [Halomonas sp. M20]
MINDTLRESLAACHELPSLPSAVLKVIELAQNPDARLQSIIEALQHDSALTARLISLANTVYYAQSRSVETLREAVERLGMELTVSLALGFSLARSYGNRAKPERLDLHYYWQRSLTSAIAAQELARSLPRKLDTDSIFTAALLQDIGMLALDAIEGPAYAEIVGDLHCHDDVCLRERGGVGADHSEVGAWLAANWGLSRRCRDWIRRSHDYPAQMHILSGGECVMLSGRLADLLLTPNSERTLSMIEPWLGEADKRAALLESIQARLPTIADMFDVTPPERVDADHLLFEGKKALLKRTLHLHQQVDQQQNELKRQRKLNARLDRAVRLDTLTGLYNRQSLTRLFMAHFAKAQREALPLALVFIDLDHFKRINDEHGHHHGDMALKSFAALLSQMSQSGMVAGRFGGEEFIAILPGHNLESATRFANRLCANLRAKPLVRYDETVLFVTASIGVASLDGGDFAKPDEMLRTADQRMYLSKRGGRDRVTSGRSAS